ncbi:Endonuclease/exonuclease/phosphatase [Bombardia bombarda]|uniref:Endonuclease/exonuclease/phosphatase n=1 Tax=Bombardia bombarda TaxID=252184 RepID=A0AA40CEE7_9PEZI|nr:Endonuclease/exonuclease/phosphatase [Bombardia bombarda]
MKPSSITTAAAAAAAAAAGLAFAHGVLAAAPTAGDLSILSMNVAGLPAILNSNDVPGDKTTNAQTIGAAFSRYGFDIIHVQEDFNYHAAIYAADTTHPYRTATSGGVPFGSGLNTLSNLPWLDFTRVKWDRCSDASSSDCLTPKGFTFMRVALSGGLTGGDNSAAVYVDVYNMHTDAGTEADDLVARQSNINQVAAYIAAWSAGNAVLVYGDSNSRYSRAGDTAIRGLLASGMSDAWVELERGGAVSAVETLCGNPSTTDYCETVDKVFYRSSPLATLTPAAFAYVGGRFLQADGNILSDHNPVQVNFTWAAGSALRQSNFWGGPHGTYWLDGVGLTLADGTSFSHGGTGGTAATLALGAAEYWVGAQLCQGQKSGETRNFYIRATTSAGRTLAAGTATEDCATFAAPAGWHIAGYVGQGGDEVDQLAFVYAPR